MEEGIAGTEVCGDTYSRRSHQRTHDIPDSTNPFANEGSSRSSSTNKEEEIYELVKQLSITPINNSVLSIHWLASSFKFLQRNAPIVQTVFNTWSRELKHKSFNELCILFEHSTPYFACTSLNITDYYYSREESLSRVEFLLNYQMPDIDQRVEFLNNLYLTISKCNGKKNTFLICGPASSGKTYFVRFVSNFFLSVGQIRNFTRNDTFPLNDCTDKRILLWDEQNFTRENLDTIKMLFSGDNTPANVKYENQVIIEKTPIIVTSNVDLFPDNDIFRLRMNRYQWLALPQSSEDFKQLYPLALIDLLCKYNILD